jgi:hypothetical protein
MISMARYGSLRSTVYRSMQNFEERYPAYLTPTSSSHCMCSFTGTTSTSFTDTNSKACRIHSPSSNTGLLEMGCNKDKDRPSITSAAPSMPRSRKSLYSGPLRGFSVVESIPSRAPSTGLCDRMPSEISLLRTSALVSSTSRHAHLCTNTAPKCSLQCVRMQARISSKKHERAVLDLWSIGWSFNPSSRYHVWSRVAALSMSQQNSRYSPRYAV